MSRIDIKVPPSQHVSGVYSVRKQQPAEELHLGCVFGLPDPMKRWVWDGIFEAKLVID